MKVAFCQISSKTLSSNYKEKVGMIGSMTLRNHRVPSPLGTQCLVRKME